MKHFTNLLLSSACAVALLSGCSGKDGDPGPAGATGAQGPVGAQGPAGTSGQNLTGNIFGFVNPIDESGVALPKSGVSVTLDGVMPAATAITDANGRYEFQTIRNGTYNLTYSRSGLGNLRRISIAHVGGDQPTFLGTSTLSQPSTTSITSFSFGSPQPGNFVPFTLTVSNPSPSVSLRATVFVGAAPTVSSSTGTTLGTYIASGTGSSTINSSISRATLNNAGLVSGTTAYAIAYGTPTSLTTFVDPVTGRLQYTSLSTSPSSVVSFIVP